MNMPRNIFNSIFGGRKKQKQNDEDEDIRPPERRLSISKSGRMKEKNKQRQTLTDGFFPTDQSDNKQVKSNDLQTQVDNTTIKNDARKASLCDEELNIDDVIREIQQTAL